MTGGRLRGRRLRVPPGGVRPTSDRVRESLFGRLGDLEGLSVLDLYAGSGALAVEALSRGAERAVCVERAPSALRALRDNLEALALTEAVRVVPGEALRALRRLGRSGERFDLVLLDPPYASDESVGAFEALVSSRVLRAGAVVVLERERRHPSPAVPGLAPIDERRYGDTVIARFVAEPENGSGADRATR